MKRTMILILVMSMMILNTTQASATLVSQEFIATPLEDIFEVGGFTFVHYDSNGDGFITFLETSDFSGITSFSTGLSYDIILQLPDGLKFTGEANENAEWLFGMFDDDSMETTLSVPNDYFFRPAETVVPIPSAVWLLGSGLIGIVGFRRRKHK